METNYVIFYTEDDTDDQVIFTDALQSTGNQSQIFLQHNGDQLLETLRYGDVKPDVVFLDLNMPGRSGFQTLQEIKADDSLSAIPIIILSTSNDPVTASRAKELGASLFVTKPKKYDAFIEILKLLLAIDWHKVPHQTKTFFMNVNV